jgi:malonyl-CoA decarboxylase
MYAKEFFAEVDLLNDAEFKNLLLHLRDQRDIDTKLLKLCTENYINDDSENNYIKLQEVLATERKDLFRKLNCFDESTIHLVNLRKRILANSTANQNFQKVEHDLKTLFIDWFNRGFLILKPIDWNTPASILEKIIKYESVHQINNWRELRDRIDSHDRKCFAFFHPAMATEPLIFVEIAFLDEMPNKINTILDTQRNMLSESKANTAVFYSISNCQRGLDGISFGNFLLKEVVTFIEKEIPNIKNFITLSPVPKFMTWLKTHDPDLHTAIMASPQIENISKYEKQLNIHIRDYLLISKREDQKPNDPVSRFHLGNGASLHRINFMADTSKNSLLKGASFMVNYKYDNKYIEKNHEQYTKHNRVIVRKNI